MQGAYFLGDQKIVLMDIPKPEPGAGEVLLAMQASGICGSDFRAYKRPSSEVDPDVLKVGGHEPCGVVAELGDGVTDVVVGDRVMMHHYSGCRRCAMCKSATRRCASRVERCMDTRWMGGIRSFCWSLITRV